MNILIHDGPCACPSSASASRTRIALRDWATAKYDVQLVSSELIADQPWPRYTSLLVFPHFDHLSHHTFSPHTAHKITQYLAAGGRFLAFGNGVRLAEPHRLALLPASWSPLPPRPSIGSGSLPEIGSRELVIEPILCKHHATPPSSAPMSRLCLADDAALWELPRLAPCDTQLVTPLAHYSDRPEKLAAVSVRNGPGAVVLAGFDLTQSPGWLSAVLGLLGLDRVKDQPLAPAFSPIHLVSSDLSTTRDIMASMVAETSVNGGVLVDSHDQLRILNSSPEPCSSLSLEKNQSLLLFTTDTQVPPVAPTFFDWKSYFEHLKWPKLGAVSSPVEMGSTLLHVDTVHSTQTLLAKNSRLPGLLPSGTVAVCREQTCGRGRGSNGWISTIGAIQFSLLIKLENLQSGLIFVQYLFALAVAEWIRSLGILSVRLKWPNDIYGTPLPGRTHRLEDYKKIGGILVNCTYGGPNGKECRIVIGCGLNNLSEPHPATTTCLKALIDQHNHEQSEGKPVIPMICPEVAVSGILGRFEKMWKEFKCLGFQPFNKRYLQSWLHTGQVIKYEKNKDRLLIIGLSPTHGLLRTIKIEAEEDQSSEPNHHLKEWEDWQHEQGYWGKKGGEVVDLQPDSNSFDMFAGLVRSKG